MRIHQINTDSIERILASIDNIERVRCIVTTDNRIHVEVDPLEPVARIFDRDSSYYINRVGKRISATARYHSDVPVISGAFTKEFPPTAVLPLVSFINSDSTWATLITHIKAYDSRNVILVPMIHGHVINIGDMDNLGVSLTGASLPIKRFFLSRGGILRYAFCEMARSACSYKTCEKTASGYQPG